MNTFFVEAICWMLVAALWWLFYGPYRRYCTERTRYRLFVMRDALFDAAAEDVHIQFERRAYGIVRTTLNGMLRNLEDFSLIRLFTLEMRVSRDTAWSNRCAAHRMEFEHALQELTPEERALVQQTINNAFLELLRYAVVTSLVALSLGVLIALLRPIWNLVDSIMRASYVKRIELATTYESNIAGHDDLQRNAYSPVM